MPYNRSSHLKRVARLNGWYGYDIPHPEFGAPYTTWVECEESHPKARLTRAWSAGSPES